MTALRFAQVVVQGQVSNVLAAAVKYGLTPQVESIIISSASTEGICLQDMLGCARMLTDALSRWSES